MSPPTRSFNRHQQIAALAARHRVPVITQTMSVAAEVDELRTPWRICLVGTTPAAFNRKPVIMQQPTKIELIVNMKTAKALGLFPITCRPRRRGD